MSAEFPGLQFHDPFVATHAGRQFHDAAAGRVARVDAIPQDDPLYPAEAAAAALSLDRAGDYKAALAYATLAAGAQRHQDGEPADAACVRKERRPAMGLNAGIVFLRTSVRLERDGMPGVLDDAAARGLRITTGNDARRWLEQARDDLHERGDDHWTKPHQHYINLLPRLGALAVAEHQPFRAARLGLTSLALSWMSESRRFTNGASGFTPEEMRAIRPKLKVAARGAALTAGAPLASRALAHVPGVADARQRLILFAS